MAPPPRPLLTRIGLRVLRPLLRLRRSLYYRCAGREERPVFHDVQTVCPELRTINENFDVIQSELRTILDDRDGFPLYHEADKTQKAISDTGEAWRVFFMNMTHPEIPLSNAKLCPETVAIVREIPGVLVAFFSILEAGKSVPAHNGPSFSYLRYHTALQVPANKPPTIRIKDQRHTWQVGRSILFDDSWDHEVYNEADDVRVVLIVDILRPVPWPVRIYGELVMWLNSLVIGNADWSTFDERVRARRA
jgi:aspartate beta-hydroxylase/beta-hydroxylase